MEISPFLNWIGGIIVTLLGLFGINKLVEKQIDRRWKKQDDNDSLHATNEAKQIEANSAFTQSLMLRVEKLESNIKEIQGNYLEQAIKNAKLEADNSYLKRENERLQQDYQSVLVENERLKIKIVNLESELSRTQEDLKKLRTDFERMMEK